MAFEHQGGPVPRLRYTTEEQQTWRTVWKQLKPLHQTYACAEYLEAARLLRLDREEVPQLEDVNGALRRATGFAMKPVAGLVGDRTFLRYLSRSTFLATQYMRHPSRPTPYDPTGYQAALFVAPSFAGMAERVCAWLDELPDGPGA